MSGLFYTDNVIVEEDLFFKRILSYNPCMVKRLRSDRFMGVPNSKRTA